MYMLHSDVRYAFRLLARQPLFTGVAITMLAVGIAANTAIFSVVNSLLIRPLPLRDSGQLAVVWETNAARGLLREGPSGPNYVDFKRQNASFEQLAALELGSGTVTGLGEPQQVPALRVTTNYLAVLGVRPSLGRDFAADEGFENRVVIVSHAFWQRQLEADPRAIGRRLRLDDLPYTIVGVLPQDFWSPLAADLLAPWSDADLQAKGRVDHAFGVIGRLKHGVSAERANAEMTTIERRIAEEEPRLRGWATVVVPLHRLVGEDLGRSLVVLLAAVGFVLLIACANIANLLLARAVTRANETAIRRALGATNGRLIAQFLTESVMLGIVGGCVGLLLALWGVDLLDRLLPPMFTVTDGGSVMRPPLRIDAGVLAFTMLLSIATGVIFGLAPALAAARSAVHDHLKAGSRSIAGGQLRLRRALIVSEMALALVLLVASGLTIKSFWRLQQVDPGFSVDRVLALDMELPTDSRYRDPAEQSLFFDRVLAGVQALPGVTHAAATNVLPLDSTVAEKVGFSIPDRPAQAGGQPLTADFRSITRDYFAAMDIPVRAGRAFDARDRAGRPIVAIVDETLARDYFADRGAVGRQLRIDGTDVLVVGVVGAVKQAALDRRASPTIYTSHLQVPRFRMTMVVQASGNPAALAGGVKRAVWQVDKDQPVYHVRTMQEAKSDAASAPRLTFTLLTLFAATAFSLAAIGIYGVVAYAVVQRTREIGIRLALGANGAQIVRMLVADGVQTAATGVAIGLVLSFVAARALSTLLFGVSVHDPFVFAATTTALAVVAMAATWLPARRAATIDPALSLRL